MFYVPLVKDSFVKQIIITLFYTTLTTLLNLYKIVKVAYYLKGIWHMLFSKNKRVKHVFSSIKLQAFKFSPYKNFIHF